MHIDLKFQIQIQNTFSINHSMYKQHILDYILITWRQCPIYIYIYIYIVPYIQLNYRVTICYLHRHHYSYTNNWKLFWNNDPHHDHNKAVMWLHQSLHFSIYQFESYQKGVDSIFGSINSIMISLVERCPVYPYTITVSSDCRNICLIHLELDKITFCSKYFKCIF